jgi:hypothetical protein
MEENDTLRNQNQILLSLMSPELRQQFDNMIGASNGQYFFFGWDLNINPAKLQSKREPPNKKRDTNSQVG